MVVLNPEMVTIEFLFLKIIVQSKTIVYLNTIMYFYLIFSHPFKIKLNNHISVVVLWVILAYFLKKIFGCC